METFLPKPRSVSIVFICYLFHLFIVCNTVIKRLFIEKNTTLSSFTHPYVPNFLIVSSVEQKRRYFVIIVYTMNVNGNQKSKVYVVTAVTR